MKERSGADRYRVDALAAVACPAKAASGWAHYPARLTLAAAGLDPGQDPGMPEPGRAGRSS